MTGVQTCALPIYQWILIGGHDHNGKPYFNTCIKIDFHDWQRKGSPSDSARLKIAVELNKIVGELNSGKYNNELKQGEINRLTNERNSLYVAINELKNKIIEKENQLANLNLDLQIVGSKA